MDILTTHLKETTSDIRNDLWFALDAPRSGQPIERGSNGVHIKVAGWCWSKEGHNVTVLVKSRFGITRHSVDRHRKDVQVFINDKEGVSADLNLGFLFSIQIEETLEIGFSFGEKEIWLYEIRIAASSVLPNRNSLNELIDSGFGVYGDYFFKDNDDKSKIIVMFNGAMEAGKLKENSPAFQRWSWAEKFRHPVFCISDPTTYDDNPIRIGWYQGKKDQLDLTRLLDNLLEILTARCIAFELVTFGSSGGGYASLLAAQLGYSDVAYAINPQIDIMKFEVKSALNEFLAKRLRHTSQEKGQHFSLIDVNFLAMKENCTINYLQNVDDQDHYSNHMIPYANALLRSQRPVKFNLHTFSNPAIGHNPPALDGLATMFGKHFSGMLK